MLNSKVSKLKSLRVYQKIISSVGMSGIGKKRCFLAGAVLELQFFFLILFYCCWFCDDFNKVHDMRQYYASIVINHLIDKVFLVFQFKGSSYTKVENYSVSRTTCLLHDNKFEDIEWVYSFVIGTVKIGRQRFGYNFNVVKGNDLSGLQILRDMIVLGVWNDL